MQSDMLNARVSPPALDGIGSALFIQPHPDDNEIGAGGLMAMLAQRGVKVWELTVTDDTRECAAQDIKDGFSLRQREALASMRSLSVENAGFLGFEDKTEATVEEITRAIIPVIRRIKPDAVFSVDPTLTNECHRDHIKVGWAVRYAVLDAQCDFYPRMDNARRHTDTWQAAILGQYYTAEPNKIIDIDAFWERKLQAVNMHVSQVEQSLLTALDMQARYFGTQAGCTRAEAYKLYSAVQLHCFNVPIG